MFASAVKIASNYTLPVIISSLLYDRTVQCGCASFIILNEDGWIMTSAHVLQALRTFQLHSKELSDYEKKKSEIKARGNLAEKQKLKMIRNLHANQKWIIKNSYWWGVDNVSVKSFSFNDQMDIAVGKLEPFDSSLISVYPTFKNPNEEMPVGTSLCKLGFPFHNIVATYDEGKNAFQLKPGTIPVPRFPIDGIHTRVAVYKDQNTNIETKFIETSSPGLRGQSGGPIFDVHGHVWALQSRTSNFSLGFNPKIKLANKEVEEHQFINIGYGTHVDEIVKFLTGKGINFHTSSLS